MVNVSTYLFKTFQAAIVWCEYYRCERAPLFQE